MIVILGLFHAFGHAVPWPWLLAASLPASLVAAQVGYVAVERPSIALGRRLAPRRARLAAVSAQAG